MITAKILGKRTSSLTKSHGEKTKRCCCDVAARSLISQMESMGIVRNAHSFPPVTLRVAGARHTMFAGRMREQSDGDT